MQFSIILSLTTGIIVSKIIPRFTLPSGIRKGVKNGLRSIARNEAWMAVLFETSRHKYYMLHLSKIF